MSMAMLSQVIVVSGSGIGECKVNQAHLCPCAPHRQRPGGPPVHPPGSIFADHISSKGTSCPGRLEILLGADTV